MIVILRYKGRCRESRNLLNRADAYDTVRTQTVLPLHQIKTVESKMKRQRMVCIKNTQVEDYVFRLNPDSSSDIYMNVVK